MQKYLDHDPSFSVFEKLQKQIELEDWVNWARRDIKYPLLPMLPKKLELSVTAAYLFKRGISIINP